MKIAILGAGFSGLATAWHLLMRAPFHSNLTIQVFDSKDIGKGTSGISAGLLHSFAGAHSKLNRFGIEGYNCALELLQIASKALGRPVMAEKKGLLRPALTDEQKSDFKACALLHPIETDWLEAPACQALLPGSVFAPGLWIKRGLTVYSALYLKGLGIACAKKGVEFITKTIHSLNEFNDFDLTIIAGGAESKYLPELSKLPLKTIKGQLLELNWPKGLPSLACPINSDVYLVMGETGNSCLVGATFEKQFEEAQVDLKFAIEELLPKAYKLYPPLQKATVKACYAGLRAVTPSRLPIIQQLPHNCWFIGGMGSKGLLYHALFAKELVHQIEKLIDFF